VVKRKRTFEKGSRKETQQLCFVNIQYHM